MTQNTSLKDLLAGAQLPALPQSAIRLLELAQDPENGPAEFAVPIEADPGLTGQVLRFVNSSYFGFSREISNVKLAITLVGIRTIKNFALWSAVFSLMPNPKSGPFDLKSLWQDSLRRGLFARAVGKHLGLKDAEDLFAAALLQDMAVPLLAKELGDKYRNLIEGRSEGQTRMSDLERETFGWTHAEAGGVIARGWSLPEGFAELIESHLDLDQYLGAPEKEPGRVAVALSALLPATADESWPELPRFQAAYDKVMKGGPTVAETLERVDKDYEEFAPVLKLNNPSVSLVELLHQSTEKAGA
ncbi:HDOD domain-containing protein [bacterium]|nr:HDOD domain-containing protein [bacterium]